MTEEHKMDVARKAFEAVQSDGAEVISIFSTSDSGKQPAAATDEPKVRAQIASKPPTSCP